MAQRARDRCGPSIALQVLIYPVTDADFERPSYLDAENQLLLTRDAVTRSGDVWLFFGGTVLLYAVVAAGTFQALRVLQRRWAAGEEADAGVPYGPSGTEASR